MKQLLSFILLFSLTNCDQDRQCNPTIDNWDIIMPRCQEILRLYEKGLLELRLEYGRGHYHIPDSLLLGQDYSDILAVTLGTRTEIFDGTYIAYFEGNGIEIIYTNNDQHQDDFDRPCIRELDQNWYLRKKTKNDTPTKPKANAAITSSADKDTVDDDDLGSLGIYGEPH